MARPIIVVGMNRTGTKWVSNILCAHEDVIGVQSHRAGGILETNMFGTMQDKFDLTFPTDYVGLIELWSQTQFFKRAGIEKELFYRLDPRPRDALTLFELLMTELARRAGKAWWVQKTSPVKAGRVLEHFRDARVVIVRRNLADTIRSAYGLEHRFGTQNLQRVIRRSVYESKLLDRLSGQYAGIEIRYESLRADPAAEKTRLFTALGLDPARADLEDRFPRNTSFSNEAQRRQILSPREETMVRFLTAAWQLVPLPVLSAGVALRTFARRRRPLPLMPGAFDELVDRLADPSRGRQPPERATGLTRLEP